jgi:hypothetical protein
MRLAAVGVQPAEPVRGTRDKFLREPAKMTGDERDAEALRLVKAFAEIDDPAARSIILKLAESAAGGAGISIREIAYAASSGLEPPKPH